MALLSQGYSNAYLSTALEHRIENLWEAVQRVLFGLYIKHGPRKLVPDGEAPALRVVEQHTDVPAPRLIEVLTSENYTLTRSAFTGSYASYVVP